MEIVLASLGVLLPWVSGSLIVVCLWKWRGLDPSCAHALGYGWPLGITLLIFWMRLLNLVGWRFDLMSVALPFGLILVSLATILIKRASWKELWARRSPWQALTFWGKVLWWGFLTLLALRTGQFLLEILWRPTFGWDAWAHWATKAKVWSSLGGIVPFGTVADMLTGNAHYTDANPHYPTGIPLIQVWMALCVDRWDDTVINLPWLAFMLSLGFGFYAQLRAAAAGPLFALGATYLLLSLPFLGVHVALPGYADLPLAVYVGLGSMSFWRWATERRVEHLLLALACALSGPLLKTPGWIWLTLLAPSALPVLFGKRGWRMVLALGGAAALALFVVAHYEPLLLGYHLRANFQPVWKPLAETTLLLNNWHLLWYAALAAIVLRGRTLFSPRFAPLTVFLGAGFAFLFVVFFFSNAAFWVSDFSTVNRALLHITPTLFFVLALLALDLRQQMSSPFSSEKPNTDNSPT